jgi:glycosyltransferase involved in cell wall biosynthesis
VWTDRLASRTAVIVGHFCPLPATQGNRRLGFTTAFTATSETRALKRADVLIAIQKNDARALQHIVPAVRVVTVENHYSKLVPRSSHLDTGVILYVASANEYNRHGLMMFLGHAWRQMLQACPKATLHVVDALGEKVIGAHEGVVFRGRVTDANELAEIYASAHVVINPQVSDTGLKIKAVEAISVGCPGGMDAAGADGIEEGAGTAFLVASDWQQFAEHVLRILTDDAFRLALEGAAERFANKRFGTTSLFDEFSAILDQHEAQRLDWCLPRMRCNVHLLAGTLRRNRRHLCHSTWRRPHL